jgi:hypothetical protein
MSRAKDVIENPVTGERAVVRLGTEETGGGLLVVDALVKPGAAVSGEHVHPVIEECFTVVGGRVGFLLDGHLFGLAQGGTTNSKGMPNLLQGAPFAQEFEDVPYFTRPPRPCGRCSSASSRRSRGSSATGEATPSTWSAGLRRGSR